MITSRRKFLQTTALGVTVLPRRVLGVGWVAAGCVVVGVGIVVGVWVIPFCQKHFGKTEKDEDGGDEFTGNIFAASGEEMAALDCVHYKVNCEEGAPSPLFWLNAQLPSESQGVEIDVVLTDRAGQPHVEQKVRLKKPEVPMGFEQFQSHLMTRHGLEIRGGTGSQSSYGRNRQPATAEQVPISFAGGSSAFPGVIIGGGDGPLRTVALERTNSFGNWTTITKLTTAVNGKPIRFTDTKGNPHAFYRVRLES